MKPLAAIEGRLRRVSTERPASSNPLLNGMNALGIHANQGNHVMDGQNPVSGTQKKNKHSGGHGRGDGSSDSSDPSSNGNGTPKKSRGSMGNNSNSSSQVNAGGNGIGTSWGNGTYLGNSAFANLFPWIKNRNSPLEKAKRDIGW